MTARADGWTHEDGRSHWTGPDGWTITRYATGGIFIEKEDGDRIDVEIRDGELRVYSEGRGGWEGPSPEAVYIPLPVLREIVRLMEGTIVTLGDTP